MDGEAARVWKTGWSVMDVHMARMQGSVGDSDAMNGSYERLWQCNDAMEAPVVMLNPWEFWPFKQGVLENGNDAWLWWKSVKFPVTRIW